MAELRKVGANYIWQLSEQEHSIMTTAVELLQSQIASDIRQRDQFFEQCFYTKPFQIALDGVVETATTFQQSDLSTDNNGNNPAVDI